MAVQGIGFTKNAVYENDQGGVEHAQLVHGNGMIMLGGARHDDFGQHIAQSDEIGGHETRCAYVIVAECKAHYDHARAAGALIVNEYSEKDYGGGYSCRDPEGHLWSFGSYDPWQAE